MVTNNVYTAKTSENNLTQQSVLSNPRDFEAYTNVTHFIEYRELPQDKDEYPHEYTILQKDKEGNEQRVPMQFLEREPDVRRLLTHDEFVRALRMTIELLKTRKSVETLPQEEYMQIREQAHTIYNLRRVFFPKIEEPAEITALMRELDTLTRGKPDTIGTSLKHEATDIEIAKRQEVYNTLSQPIDVQAVLPAVDIATVMQEQRKKLQETFSGPFIG